MLLANWAKPWHAPPAAWVAGLLHDHTLFCCLFPVCHLSQAVHEAGSLPAQELSVILWAMAKFQHTSCILTVLCSARCCVFMSQAVHEAGSFNAQELSVIFWAMAKLQHTPPAAWVAGLLREGLEVAGGLQAQSLVLLMGALTRWQLPQMHTKGHYRCGCSKGGGTLTICRHVIDIKA